MTKWVVYGESTETGIEYIKAGPFDSYEDAQEALNQLVWKDTLTEYEYYLGIINDAD